MQFFGAFLVAFSVSVSLLLTLVDGQGCIFSETECTCSLNSGGNTCLQFKSGSGDSTICDAYACSGGYICDCSGDLLCPVESCGHTIYHPLVEGAVPGDTVGCTGSPKDTCVREPPSPSPIPVPSTVPTGPDFIRLVPFSDIPSIPSGLKQSASTNPYVYEPAALYPIFDIGPYTYWPLSYVDDRNAFGIAVFDYNGGEVIVFERAGAKTIYQVEKDEVTQEIVFIGENLDTVRMTWAELTTII